MSRFQKEWTLVPTAARVIAALVYLAYLTLMASIWLLPPAMEKQFPHPVQWGFFIGTAALGLLLWAFVLLVGYIWADATRRQMNAVLWVLLAIFIPNAIGIILYFILRDPLTVPCPSCGTPAGKDEAFCSGCGASVRPSCAECRQPVQSGWTHCGRCGAALTSQGTP
jgi:hypothetical protein